MAGDFPAAAKIRDLGVNLADESVHPLFRKVLKAKNRNGTDRQGLRPAIESEGPLEVPTLSPSGTSSKNGENDPDKPYLHPRVH